MLVLVHSTFQVIRKAGVEYRMMAVGEDVDVEADHTLS